MSSPDVTLEMHVVEFFDALEAMVPEGLRPLLDPEIRWCNTGLPTVRGKWVERVLLLARRLLTNYEVTEITELRAVDDTVYSQRREIIRAGPFAMHLDVTGQYTFRDGLLHIWDDHFSYIQLMRGIRFGDS